MVTRWGTKGEPNCWCYDCHNRGDIDGDCAIGGTDIMGFDATSGWSYAFTSGYGADSDIDYDGAIGGTDIMGYDGSSGWSNGFSNQCGPCVQGVIMNP
jgi:hypothetical protein